MSAKKDMNRVKELLFGNDISQFEEKFDILQEQLNKLQNNQVILQKSVKKKFKSFNKKLNGIKDHQIHFTKDLKKQGRVLDNYMDDMTEELQHAAQQTEDQLKSLKIELKMYIEAKLNGLNKAKISHSQLSEMFASLSDELKDADDKQRHTK